jgi:ubiquinone biosynthesis protein
MKISSIPQIYRNLNRWRDVLTVLSKYELGHWISRLGPDYAKDLLKTRGGAAIARLSWETRVRMALADLGPTFIKLGQLLSTRPDLVGISLAAELQNLQANVPADPVQRVRQTILAELGRPVEELFGEFDGVPLASASIGQVHHARLRSGEPVVVKVQHADIEPTVAVDLEILAGLAQLAERIPEFQMYRPRAIAAELHRTLSRELDFRRELRNLQQFAHDFCRDPGVRIPRPYPQFSSRRVLTMELIEGIKLSELDRLTCAGVDLDEIARRGAAICLEMIFVHGFYHADPHPGNLLLLDHNVIGLLDFGMVGRLDEQLQEDVGELLAALGDQDAERVTAMILRIGRAPIDLDRGSFALDVADFIAHYANQPLEQFDLSGALNEVVEQIRCYHVMLPARIAMLIKALVTLEGTSRLLSPRFNLVELIEPYRNRMLWRRYSPRRQMRKVRRLYSEVEHLVELLPNVIQELLQQVQSGKFDVHLDHRGLEPSVNRLVLGMLASALFLGSSLLLSHQVPPRLYGVSAPGIAGILTSIALGLRLWRAISKSGRLDRRSRD